MAMEEDKVEFSKAKVLLVMEATSGRGNVKCAVIPTVRISTAVRAVSPLLMMS